jgi:exodeoxyribonuclease VII small subunit
MSTKQSAKQTGTDKAGAPSFEQALERLETIVGDMEYGTLNLDAMIERFEEGQALIALCGRKLNEVERKIEKLVKRGDALATEPFQDVPETEEPEPDDAGELF